MYRAIEILILIALCLPCTAEEKWYVGKVKFYGNKHISSSALHGRMQQKPAGIFHKVEYTFSNLVEDIYAIQLFYRNRGYFDAIVGISSIVRDSTKHRVNIDLDIKEGVPTCVKRIDFVNNSALSDEKLRSSISLKVGAPLDSTAYFGSSQIIRDSLAVLGYWFSNISESYTIDSCDMTAIVLYRVDEGPIVLAGKPEIQGLFKTKSIVVKRELRFHEGEVLTSIMAARTTTALYGTGLFTGVLVEPLDTVSGNFPGDTVIVPILVLLREGNMFNISANGGFDAYEGFYGIIDAMYRNLFRMGRRITISGKVAQVGWGGQVSYMHPWFLNKPLFPEINAYIRRDEYGSFFGLFDGGVITVDGKAGEYNLYRVWSSLDRVEYLHVVPSALGLVDSSTKSTLLLGAGFSRDTRAEVNRPGRGIFTFTQSEITAPFAWSNQFYRLREDLRGYYTFYANLFSISSAMYIGYINGYAHEKGSVPVQQLFRIGLNGVRPVRGYDDKDVEPVDSRGNPIGGKFALIFNVFEFRYPIYQWITGAVFSDVGYVWPSIHSFNLRDLHWSVGPGILADLPIGLVDVDYGVQLGRGGFKGRVYFNLGLPF